MEREPEYSSLSLSELLDVERHIDRELVPERWARVQNAIVARRREGKVPYRASTPLSLGCFVVLHVCFAPVVIMSLLSILAASGGEAAEGWSQIAVIVMPCAVLLSLLSAVVYKWYAAPQSGRWARAAGSVIALPLVGAVLGFFGIMFLAWLMRMRWLLR